MGPLDAQIIRTFISEAPPAPLVQEDAVRVGDATTVVVECEFGVAFPAVQVTVVASILDLATGTPPVAPMTIMFPAAPGQHVQRTFPVLPAATFVNNVNHVCEITACLSAPTNANFPPDASFVTQQFLVTA